MDNDILELANDIKNSKEDIRQAIINKGVNVSSSVRFSDYAKKIGAIKKASDYTVTEVDAINYSGKDVVAGDKIWIVPYNVTEDGEVKSLNISGIVSRDGTTIYTYNSKYDIATQTYTTLTSTSSLEMFRWGTTDIYSLTNSKSESFILKRGDTSMWCWYYDDLYQNRNGELFYKDEKIGDTSYLTNAYGACFDRTNNYIYLYNCEYNKTNYIKRYKVNLAEKSVEEDGNFNVEIDYNDSRALLGVTTDGKYLLVREYTNNARFRIAKISDTGLQWITDLSVFSEDLAGIYYNPSAYVQFNGVDDILLMTYNNYHWVFKYANDKFTLISKIAALVSRDSYKHIISSSADGKVICAYEKYQVLKNVDNTYKAISFTAGSISSDGFSGVAKGNAGSGETFKVGVVLPVE